MGFDTLLTKSMQGETGGGGALQGPIPTQQDLIQG